MLPRLLFSALARGGSQARLSTLIFHRVLPEPDPLFPGEVDARRFAELCGWVRRWFNVLPLREAAERLFRGDLPERALTLSFDDGYADNLLQAAPILRQHGLPCTFFIATGFLDGGCMWNDVLIESVRRSTLPKLDLRGLAGVADTLAVHDVPARRAAIDSLIGHAKYLEPAQRLAFVHEVARRSGAPLPDDLMLSSAQVGELKAAGFDIGAHTVNHPILARLDSAAMRCEIETSRQRLQQLTGGDVPLFAYPNGKPGTDYTADAVRVVREAGFEAAVSTSWGVSTPSTDRFQLARFTPWDATRLRFAMRLAGNYRVRPTAV